MAHRQRRSEQVNDLIRAGCGGLLFGVPLLYTLEVWQYGSTLPPAVCAAVLLALVVLATVLDHSSGFRFSHHRTWSESAIDGIEVVAISLVLAAAILIVIGEITFDSSLRSFATKVITEAVPLAIGGAIANEFLVADNGEDAGQSSDQSDQQPRTVLSEAGGAAIGAIVIGLSIAPTDEVTAIASRLRGVNVVSILVVSLVVSHALVFESGLKRSARHLPHSTIEFGRTAVAYCVAIAVSVVMLALYGRLGDGGDVRNAWTHVVVLALPASVGAAAGRLAA